MGLFICQNWVSFVQFFIYVTHAILFSEKCEYQWRGQGGILGGGKSPLHSKKPNPKYVQSTLIKYCSVAMFGK